MFELVDSLNIPDKESNGSAESTSSSRASKTSWTQKKIEKRMFIIEQKLADLNHNHDVSDKLRWRDNFISGINHLIGMEKELTNKAILQTYKESLAAEWDRLDNLLNDDIDLGQYREKYLKEVQKVDNDNFERDDITSDKIYDQYQETRHNILKREEVENLVVDDPENILTKAAALEQAQIERLKTWLNPDEARDQKILDGFKKSSENQEKFLGKNGQAEWKTSVTNLQNDIQTTDKKGPWSKFKAWMPSLKKTLKFIGTTSVITTTGVAFFTASGPLATAAAFLGIARYGTSATIRKLSNTYQKYTQLKAAEQILSLNGKREITDQDNSMDKRLAQKIKKMKTERLALLKKKQSDNLEKKESKKLENLEKKIKKSETFFNSRESRVRNATFRIAQYSWHVLTALSVGKSIHSVVSNWHEIVKSINQAREQVQHRGLIEAAKTGIESSWLQTKNLFDDSSDMRGLKLSPLWRGYKYPDLPSSPLAAASPEIHGEMIPPINLNQNLDTLSDIDNHVINLNREGLTVLKEKSFLQDLDLNSPVLQIKEGTDLPTSNIPTNFTDNRVSTSFFNNFNSWRKSQNPIIPSNLSKSQEIFHNNISHEAIVTTNSKSNSIIDVLRNQLESNPENFGYNAETNGNLHHWASVKANNIAANKGYFGADFDTHVMQPGKSAYVLEGNDTKGWTVTEYHDVNHNGLDISDTSKTNHSSANMKSTDTKTPEISDHNQVNEGFEKQVENMVAQREAISAQPIEPVTVNTDSVKTISDLNPTAINTSSEIDGNMDFLCKNKLISDNSIIDNSRVEFISQIGTSSYSPPYIAKVFTVGEHFNVNYSEVNNYLGSLNSEILNSSNQLDKLLEMRFGNMSNFIPADLWHHSQNGLPIYKIPELTWKDKATLDDVAAMIADKFGVTMNWGEQNHLEEALATANGIDKSNSPFIGWWNMQKYGVRFLKITPEIVKYLFEIKQLNSNLLAA